MIEVMEAMIMVVTTVVVTAAVEVMAMVATAATMGTVAGMVDVATGAAATLVKWWRVQSPKVCAWLVCE